LAVFGVLINEGEFVLVKSLEELVPLDRLELPFATVAREVDAEQAGVAALGPFDAGRVPAALFHPAADFVVVDGHFSRT
jgi:hypothetical protein